MKWPCALPDIRDELKNLSTKIKGEWPVESRPSPDGKRLDELIGCLTEAIVDQARD